jgi:hypothetical protein
MLSTKAIEYPAGPHGGSRVVAVQMNLPFEMGNNRTAHGPTGGQPSTPFHCGWLCGIGAPMAVVQATSRTAAKTVLMSAAR